MDDFIESDKEKVQNGIQQWRENDGISFPSMPKIIESVFGILCICTVIAMMIALPFVGPSKRIPGEIWMGFGGMGIVAFGAGWYLFRLINSRIGEEIDRTVSQRFERGR